MKTPEDSRNGGGLQTQKDAQNAGKRQEMGRAVVWTYYAGKLLEGLGSQCEGVRETTIRLPLRKMLATAAGV